MPNKKHKLSKDKKLKDKRLKSEKFKIKGFKKSQQQLYDTTFDEIKILKEFSTVDFEKARRQYTL